MREHKDSQVVRRTVFSSGYRLIEIGGLISLVCFWGWIGCGGGKGDSNAQHLPAAGTEIPPYPTTLTQTWKPLLPAVWLNYPDPATVPDLGVLIQSEGDPYLRRDDLGAGGSGTEARVSLLYFSHLSDIHLCDDESPMRMTNIDLPGPTQAAFRPQDNLSVQVLDAMIRTLNHFSNDRPFDFLMVTGDSIDNDHWIEVRWLIDTFDGKIIDPDTGADDDPISGPANDYADPFLAWGLDPRVPWYTVIGNHDGLIQGNLSPTVNYDQTATGSEVFWGTRDGSTPEAGRIHNGRVPADPDRRLLGMNRSPRDFIEEFFQTSSLPVGHGFTPDGREQGYGYYSFNPVPEVPVRVIVLSTYNREEGLSEGSLDRDQFENFFIPELDRARQEKELVIVASHHPPGNFLISEVSEEEFILTLFSFPNVFLHLVGHGHKNRIIPRMGANPGEGYWEIEAPSLMDYPQQAHIMEIVNNGDGTGSVFSTVADHNSPKGSLSYESRALSLMDVQTGGQEAGQEGDPEDRNVELIFKIPSEMVDIVNQSAGSTRIESLTTLMVEQVN